MGLNRDHLRRLRHLVYAGVTWIAIVAGMVLHEPTKQEAVDADAIIVLGAAVAGDEPSPVFRARLDHAVDLYRDGRATWIILTGGRSAGDAVSEGAAGRSYLLKRQVPAGAILVDEDSRTTLENLQEAKRLMGDVDARRALVVTDPLHLLRSRLMWQDLGLTAVGAPTRYSRYQGLWSRAKFAAREVAFLHVYLVARK